jgi:hypothetical protein
MTQTFFINCNRKKNVRLVKDEEEEEEKENK